MNNKLNKIIFLSIIFNLFFIRTLSANEETSVQYYFDDRYNFYSDSERISSRVNRRIFYRHSDVFKEALIDYQQSLVKISYSQCRESNTSDFIIKLEPNFFYNPLMQTMYADLNYYIYQEPSKQLDHGTLSIKKQMYIQARPDIQLKNLYLEFLNQLSEKLPTSVPDLKINGEFCKLI
ncbi:MAG: hypothetical protein O3A03_00010 [Proteobacteria bacterium]|nr:hypothetical protein [Pseudomonadota bacterium]MDA0942295.1 hypothetical protein [Pseudomonadota bacterium]MDA1034498.1 hypothetical protein [Pseudomonadota bacterium]